VAGWDGARWITMAGKGPNSPGAPLLRGRAALGRGPITAARLYASALGVFEAYVNGHRVTVPHGDGAACELLTPGWTDYDRTIGYTTYDMTGAVAGEREVTLAAVLGNGWYDGRVREDSTCLPGGGNRLAPKAGLLVRYTDGPTQTLVTAPGAGWRAADTGPYRADDIHDGQTYDARKEIPGWTADGFDASGRAGVEEHDHTSRFPDARLVAYPGETAVAGPFRSVHRAAPPPPVCDEHRITYRPGPMPRPEDFAAGREGGRRLPSAAGRENPVAAGPPSPGP
jgi:alpha-L-rhamnosidase